MSDYEPLATRTVLEKRYRIRRLLSQGGMGAVYLAVNTRFKRPVAIKENFVQTGPGVDREASMRQFREEATVLNGLHHPHLPRVTDLFIEGERQYLVMDYIEGQDLWDRIETQGEPLTEGAALEIIIQVCDALIYLHSQDPPVLHRDIKPQNIKVTPEGRVVLVDFGLAKVGGADVETHLGARGWTNGFSPPEQYMSSQRTLPASDIYALGATLYALLTATEPPASTSLTTGITRCTPPEILNPKLSDRVSRAIAYAMEIKITDRPQSVAVWQFELKTILENLEVEVKTSLARRARAQREAGLPWLWMGIAAVILIAIIFAVVYFNRGGGNGDDNIPTAVVEVTAEPTEVEFVAQPEVPTETPSPEATNMPPPTPTNTPRPTFTPIPPTNTPFLPTDTPPPPTNTPSPTTTATNTPPTTPTPLLGTDSTQIRSTDGMTMVYVPAGSFLMGSADSDPDAQDNEKPQHKVTLVHHPTLNFGYRRLSLVRASSILKCQSTVRYLLFV